MWFLSFFGGDSDVSFELKLLERNISSDGLGGVAAKVGEVSDMRENEVGIGGGESGCGIVAREEGDGGELSRTGRMDVMNHVSYVGGRSWVQLVAGEDFDNSFPLVDDARVDALEGGGHAEALGLSEESFFVHAGEDEEAKPFLLRSSEEVSGIGKGSDEVFGLEEGFFEEDLEFLGSIGHQPRELFDFVEDYADEATPSPEAAILIAAARRDFFQVVQNGEASDTQVTPAELPPKDSELEGTTWLPRIITKARAKLRGELHPDIMYACGGDRNFLRTHDIHPADFLRAVWAAGDDDAKIADYVRHTKK